MSYAAYMVCCPYKTLGVTGKTMKNFKFGPGSQPCMRRTVRQPDFPSVPCPDIVPRVIPSEHPLKSGIAAFLYSGGGFHGCGNNRQGTQPRFGLPDRLPGKETGCVLLMIIPAYYLI